MHILPLIPDTSSHPLTKAYAVTPIPPQLLPFHTCTVPITYIRASLTLASAPLRARTKSNVPYLAY